MAHLHEYRSNIGETTTRMLNPIQAIKAQCLECCGFSRQEVERCSSPLCSLFPFRLGDSGNRGKMSEERKEALRAHMNELRTKATTEEKGSRIDDCPLQGLPVKAPP